MISRWLCWFRGHRWYTTRVPQMADGQIGIDVCTRCGVSEKVYTT